MAKPYPFKPTDMVAWSGRYQDNMEELRTYTEPYSRYEVMLYGNLQKFKIDLEIAICWKHDTIHSKLVKALLRSN